MYSMSSQKIYWTFKNEKEIAENRLKHNQQFILKHGAGLDVNN